jgi:hypothetical protein
MASPVDQALVHALAMHHVEELQKGRRSVPREVREDWNQRLCYAIDQAIETELEGIEREIPE